VRINTIPIASSLNSLGLEMKRIARPEIKPDVVVSVRVVPNGTLVRYITD